MTLNIGTALVLPPTVWGFFEWFTGMVRINMEHERFENGDLNETEKQELNETYYHEFFHCCQIATTGYLYYYIAQFLKEIAPLWRIITEKSVEEKLTVPLMLEAVFRERQEPTQNMKVLLSNLDKIGESHFITARTVIESQAFLVQKKISVPNLTHHTFIELLKDVPAEEYSDAYIMATEYLGNLAFGYFNAIAYCSLLFFEPQHVFEKICSGLSGKECVEENFTGKLKDVVQKLKEQYLFLGDSDDVTSKYILNQEVNPFYKTSIEMLRSICEEQQMDFLSLMSRPETWLKDSITRFDLPVIFNNGYIYENHVEKKWWVFDKTYTKTLHLVLGTICLIVSNQRQDFSPHYLHLRKQKSPDLFGK